MKPLERARQSLQGLVVGDAFGETLFGEPVESTRRAVARELSPRRPWRWTDDTAMALSVVEVLARFDRIDPDALAEAFVRRFSAEPDRGYGRGARMLLEAIQRGAAWRDEAQALFDGQGSYGNGAAMRAAPIGAYFAGDLDRVCAEARRSAQPTHAHPDGIAGAVAAAAAAALVATGRATASTLVREVLAVTPPGQTREGLARAADLDLATDPDAAGTLLGTGRDVASHDTVPFCIWAAARHLDSYEDALWTAASRHGDRDTLAAIVGGIVVLATGVDAIPVAWREATEPLP